MLVTFEMSSNSNPPSPLKKYISPRRINPKLTQTHAQAPANLTVSEESRKCGIRAGNRWSFFFQRRHLSRSKRTKRALRRPPLFLLSPLLPLSSTPHNLQAFFLNKTKTIANGIRGVPESVLQYAPPLEADLRANAKSTLAQLVDAPPFDPLTADWSKIYTGFPQPAVPSFSAGSALGVADVMVSIEREREPEGRSSSERKARKHRQQEASLLLTSESTSPVSEARARE